MATVILGIAACGVIVPFVNGVSVQVEGRRRTLAAKMASDLMEQIVRIDFEQLVDTYNGYQESEGQVKDAAGRVFEDSNYSKFSRDVSCAYVYVPQESGVGTAKFILAIVRVFYAAEQVVVINRLICE